MRLIGLLNYIYTLKMKTLTLLFSLFLMCPLSVWGQSADELLSKVSDALSEGKDDYAVSLFRQAANAGEDRTEMFYWTNVDKSSEVAPRLADVLAVHYKEMRNYDKAYLFYKEFLQRHPEDVPALVSCSLLEAPTGRRWDGHIYIKGVTVRFGFDAIRTSQLPNVCQEQSNGDAPWDVLYIQPLSAHSISAMS